ncbi:hypothetical protein I7X12_16560 [Halosimplex litoreum]|uniref:Uncharacterized protein n=1 Tax=Halosimplex litoreum TaxID=1198301 RepID=A0A7T3FXX8_9EURY|nr:hypothetical protein [Halosimplex litoreum]QPV62333.1 hypothetical protein I7X12_16560 [Halosimplex litoreum]
MSVGNRQGVVEAIRFDLNKFHETWMGLLYPRQRGAGDTVLGKWQPQTTRERVTYTAWAALGALVVAVLYPLALFGVVVRFHARKIDVSVEKLGAVGVLLLAVLVWGGLAALVEFRLDYSSQEANAIIAASVVAIVSAGLAVAFRAIGGRITTIVFAYPFGMTAIFLPPVVAALVSDDVAQFSIAYADQIAELVRQEVLGPVGLRSYVVEKFDMTEFAYVLIWIGISVPLGWLLGTTVALADFIRPKGE